MLDVRKPCSKTKFFGTQRINRLCTSFTKVIPYFVFQVYLSYTIFLKFAQRYSTVVTQLTYLTIKRFSRRRTMNIFWELKSKTLKLFRKGVLCFMCTPYWMSIKIFCQSSNFSFFLSKLPDLTEELKCKWPCFHRRNGVPSLRKNQGIIFWMKPLPRCDNWSVTPGQSSYFLSSVAPEKSKPGFSSWYLHEKNFQQASSLQQKKEKLTKIRESTYVYSYLYQQILRKNCIFACSVKNMILTLTTAEPFKFYIQNQYSGSGSVGSGYLPDPEHRLDLTFK